MARALFDRHSALVAWVDQDKYVFNKSYKWIAFIHDENVFSAVSYAWLGSVSGLTLQDRLGRPVAFNPDQPILGRMSPMPPIPPVPPIAPSTPLPSDVPAPPLESSPPAGGWSQLRFEQWLTQ